MNRRFASWFFYLLFALLPSLVSAGTDYSQIDPDAAEFEKLCEEAADKLGPSQGAIAIEENIVEIIGIPKGMSGAGVAVTGQVSELKSAMQDLGAQVTETEIRIDLPSDVLFDFDKSDIRPDAREALGKVAIVIRAYPERTVLIEGHTDSKGSDEYNMELSLKRAESVKKWLQEKESLNTALFQIKGWGETKPRATNETDQGRQENRRVEITIRK